jgi:hypothetical protein
VSGNYLKITDIVQFTLADDVSKFKDDYEGAFKPAPTAPPHPTGLGTVPTQQPTQVAQQQTPSTSGFRIRIAATHSGIITRNNGFYLPDKMKKGADTFTENYPKPVLLHHEDHKDPIGRIIAARYMDTSGSIQDKYKLAEGLVVKDQRGVEKGIITAALLKDFVEGKMSFGMQIDTVVSLLSDSLLDDSGYQGLGHIQLVANVTDKAAVEKLLDGRYLTGSVGATTNKAVCSVCRQDWTEEGRCDHKPGALYDGAKCFIIAGELVYDEYSFVNMPADRHSQVLELNYNGISDSIEIANEYSCRIYEEQMTFPQFDSVVKEDTGMPDKKQEASVKTEEVTADVRDKATPAAETTPESTEQNTEETQVQDQALETAPTEGSEESVQEDVTSGEGEEISEEEEDLIRLLDAEELSEEDEEKLYNALWDEAIAGFNDGEFTLEQLGVAKLEEAKLSGERRKKLSKSTFCGPDRSFPVPDCAHVTAARRLIGRYKGSGSKSSILACVSRKAKALGCEKPKKDAIESKKEDNAQHARIMRELIMALEENSYTAPNDSPALEDEEIKSLQNILKRLAGLVGKDNIVKAMVSENLGVDPACEAALVDEVVKGEEQIGELRDELDALRKEYFSLGQDLENLQDALTEAKASSRKAQEGQLSVLITLKEKKAAETEELVKLSDSALESELTRLTGEVDMGKIADKLGDGMTRTPDETVEDPTVVQDENSQKSASPVELGRIQERAYGLLFGGKPLEAQAFIRRMQQEGKLPQNSETS